MNASETIPQSRIEIDLGAIAFNVRQIRGHIGEQVRLMAVVKANAYGHGMLEVAEEVLSSGADWLAVNRVAEGVILRQAGFAEVPILVLGYAPEWEMSAVVENRLTPTITELSVAEHLNSLGGETPIHIKVDSGMGRLGVLPNEALEFVQQVASLPNLSVEGLYTHFAVADSQEFSDIVYTEQQFGMFYSLCETLEIAGHRIPIQHAANSAATMYYPQMHLDMVRPGIILYGLRPNARLSPAFEIRPALSIKTHVGRVRTLPAGSSISYGRTFTAENDIKVALVPLGYGDGIHRLLSNRGEVLIHGQRAPIVGRVCMDQFVVDVSDIADVKLNDEVVILGQQGNSTITADDIAAQAETINYEVTTALLSRMPRFYR